MASLELIIAFILILIALYIGYLIGKFITNLKLKDRIPEIREDAINHSRAVLSGQFSEQIAPYLPDFPFKPTEARFIGKPIDFVVFKGMDEKDIHEVVFVEVKSRQSNLSSVEKTLKETIKSKKVSWQEYRVPDGVVSKKSD